MQGLSERQRPISGVSAPADTTLSAVVFHVEQAAGPRQGGSYDRPMHQPIETIARGLIRSGSRVLLCRNRKHGYHYLPGGHIEFGEPARESLARELLEECGLESRVGPLLLTEEQVFTQKNKNRHEITLIFRVDRLGPNPTTMPDDVKSLEDKIDFVWADLASVPDLVIYPESTKAWLASGGGVHESDGPFLPADAGAPIDAG